MDKEEQELQAKEELMKRFNIPFSIKLKTPVVDDTPLILKKIADMFEDSRR